VHGPNCGCKDYLGVENAADLLGSIDLEKVRCLNEAHNKTGKELFREHERRFEKEQSVVSDCDGEVLLIVPFVAQVKLRSVCVIAKDINCAPHLLRLFVNNENVDFSLAEQGAVQEFHIGANLEGEAHNAVNPQKFSHVHKLIIHLKGASEETGVSYIQLKGEATNIKRQAVQTVYELNPQAKKNNLEDMTKNSYEL
jgi:hypothetical protein